MFVIVLIDIDTSGIRINMKIRFFIFTKNNYNYSKLCNNLWIIGLKHHFTDIPGKKIIKFKNCKKIYNIYIYVNCYAQNSVRNDIRCMMGYGFDSWFL